MRLEVAKILRFPGTCRCEADLVEEFEDFESREVWEEFVRSENCRGMCGSTPADRSLPRAMPGE
jgi:hypothetical protein